MPMRDLVFLHPRDASSYSFSFPLVGTHLANEFPKGARALQIGGLQSIFGRVGGECPILAVTTIGGDPPLRFGFMGDDLFFQIDPIRKYRAGIRVVAGGAIDRPLDMGGLVRQDRGNDVGIEPIDIILTDNDLTVRPSRLW